MLRRMDPLRSFSDYDLLAHVPQGFLAFAATDYVFNTQIILGRSDWNAGYIILILIASYVVGHLLAGPSHWALEKGLARRILGGSSVNLLAHDPSQSPWRFVFPEYLSQAGYPTRTAVRAQLGIAELVPERAESAFWSAYHAARKDEYTKTRLRTFLQLYGFCRNISFLAMLTGATLATSSALNMSYGEFWGASNITQIAALFLIGFFMCQRYLKFYRLYALEVFVNFASMPTSTPPAQKGIHKE